MAIASLYKRLGTKSYPTLVEAYRRLPKGRDDAGTFDETSGTKADILQTLLWQPSESGRQLFADAVKDAPLGVRVQGACGLWTLNDARGLKVLIQETEKQLLSDSRQGICTRSIITSLPFCLRATRHNLAN